MIAPMWFVLHGLATPVDVSVRRALACGLSLLLAYRGDHNVRAHRILSCRPRESARQRTHLSRRSGAASTACSLRWRRPVGARGWQRRAPWRIRREVRPRLSAPHRGIVENSRLAFPPWLRKDLRLAQGRLVMRSRSLAVAAVLLGMSGVANADTIRNFAVAGWNVTAHTQDGTSVFSHCAAGARYNSGIFMMFAVNRQYA